MAMCKECGDIVSQSEMKDGYCSKCAIDNSEKINGILEKVEDEKREKEELLKIRSKDDLMSSKFKTNHLLHFIIATVSLGLWMIPWCYITISNNNKRVEAEKNVYGSANGNGSIWVAWVVLFLQSIAYITLFLSMSGTADLESQTESYNIKRDVSTEPTNIVNMSSEMNSETEEKIDGTM